MLKRKVAIVQSRLISQGNLFHPRAIPVSVPLCLQSSKPDKAQRYTKVQNWHSKLHHSLLTRRSKLVLAQELWFMYQNQSEHHLAIFCINHTVKLCCDLIQIIFKLSFQDKKLPSNCSGPCLYSFFFDDFFLTFFFNNCFDKCNG